MIRPADTTVDAWRKQIEIFRRMPGPERVAMALQMSEAAREVSIAGIRHRHPDWAADQVHDALVEQLHGPRVAEAMRRSRLARV